MKLKKIIAGLFLILPVITLSACGEKTSEVEPDITDTPIDEEIIIPDDTTTDDTNNDNTDDDTTNNDDIEDNTEVVNPPVTDEEKDDNTSTEDEPQEDTGSINYSEFNYTITSSNALYLQPEDSYYVYFYNKNCNACDNIKEEVLQDFKYIMDNNISKIYLADGTSPNIQSIAVATEEEEYIIGSNRLNPIKICSVPTIVKIENGTVVSYAKGVSEIPTYVTEIKNTNIEPNIEKITSTAYWTNKNTGIVSSTNNKLISATGGLFWNNVTLTYDSSYHVSANNLSFDLMFNGPVNFLSNGQIAINEENKYYEFSENISDEASLSATLILTIDGEIVEITNPTVTSQMAYSYTVNGSSYISTNRNDFENSVTTDNKTFYYDRKLTMELQNVITYTFESDFFKLTAIVEDSYSNNGESKFSYEFEYKTGKHTGISSTGEITNKTYGNSTNTFTYDVTNSIIEEKIYFYDSIY